MGGVGAVLNKDLREYVLEVNRVSDKLIVVRISVGNKVINIFSTYAPQVVLGKDIKTDYCNSFSAVVGACDRSEKVVEEGDMNAHIGVNRTGYKKVHGGVMLERNVRAGSQ